jgi:hypothetical protein
MLARTGLRAGCGPVKVALPSGPAARLSPAHFRSLGSFTTSFTRTYGQPPAA